MVNPYISFKIGYYVHKLKKVSAKYWYVVWSVILILWLIILLPGCGFTTVKTEVTNPYTEKTWVIHSKNDALVKLQTKDGTKIEVDNRGSVGLWELLILRSMPETSFHLGDAKEEGD